MTLQPITHEEALELAGLYVLHALAPNEESAIDAHLAECSRDHSEFVELGAVVPALATLIEPIKPPPTLKQAVLDAYRAEVAAEPVPTRTFRPEAQAPRGRSVVGRFVALVARWQTPSLFAWAAAGLAMLLLAVLSVVGLNLRSQADHANQVAEEMSKAIAALTAPGSQVAILHGSGPAAGINGFAAFPVSTAGEGYMVMTDVPPAPTGKTYQAWYFVDGTPTSIGTMAADADGNVVASGLEPLAGTDVIAVTVEPQGGSAQPTSDPIITGNLTTVS